MTDNDIIKALELSPRCNPVEGRCSICPYLLIDDCAGKFPKDALDLINRQKAEIERLEVYANDLLMLLPQKKARAEAITEFADRLCEGRVSNDPVVIAVKVELEMMKEGVNNA